MFELKEPLSSQSLHSLRSQGKTKPGLYVHWPVVDRKIIRQLQLDNIYLSWDAMHGLNYHHRSTAALLIVTKFRRKFPNSLEGAPPLLPVERKVAFGSITRSDLPPAMAPMRLPAIPESAFGNERNLQIRLPRYSGFGISRSIR